jgi:hypothetical protein
MNLKLNRRLQTPEGDKGGGGGGGADAAAQAAAAAAAAAAAGGGNGGAAPPWFGTEANKALVESKGFKTVDDVFTWGQNAEKLIGADRAGRTVVLPKDDKDLEGIKTFREKIGVPAKAEDYGLPVPDGQDAAFSKTASTWMHEAGIPKAAAVALTTKWNEHIQKVIADSDAAIKADSDKQLTTLKGEWGGEFDANSEHARRFATSIGWDKAKIDRYEQAFGTATMLKDFFAMGKKIGEAGFTQGDGHGGGHGMTPAQAQTRIDEIRSQRLADKITQKDFLAEMDKLGPIAAKAQAA